MLWASLENTFVLFVLWPLEGGNCESLSSRAIAPRVDRWGTVILCKLSILEFQPYFQISSIEDRLGIQFLTNGQTDRQSDL